MENTDEEQENGTIDIVSTYMGYIYYSGDVEIPEHLTFKGEDIKIDGISNMAFYASERLTTVKIPASVENIENGGNEIVLDENLVKQIEELKAEKSDAYHVSIME